jgi:glycosyltransferase involved in cell wall biosynthesis
MSRSARILGAAEEDPLHHQTWSGSSAYFFSALRAEGCLSATVSASLPAMTTGLYKLKNFHPSFDKWKSRYHLDVGYYNQMTRAVCTRVESLDSSSYDIILQIGALFDLSRRPGKFTVSYHDGNLATRLQSPYGFPAVSRSRIQKALDHERNLYHKLDHMFTMSQWLADSFVRDFGVSSEKLTPIGAGINLPYIRERTDDSYEAPRILFVGKDFERKGGKVLLEAFSKVRREVPEATLTIIGPELTGLPDGATCLSYVAKNTSEGLNLLLDEYVKASVFVMPSLYEPFGIVFAEAMAHKLPCIGTNICAMPEIINDKQTGFLVPPQDARSLADRILELLKKPALSKSFGEAGYRRYREHLSWTRVAQKLVQRIRALL